MALLGVQISWAAVQPLLGAYALCKRALSLALALSKSCHCLVSPGCTALRLRRARLLASGR